MSLPIIATVLAAVAAAAWFGKSATRHGYESARYDVLLEDGAFQLRKYAPYTLVETPMASRTRDGGSFRRLFRYISGDNARSEKIAMTTPVFMSGQTDSLPGSMAFVVPEGVTRSGAPMASARDVAVRTLDGHAVASIRFRGYRRPAAIRDAELELRAWMAGRELESSGPARLAFYDPPWTPELLRRNEVQIPVVAGADSAATVSPDATPAP